MTSSNSAPFDKLRTPLRTPHSAFSAPNVMRELERRGFIEQITDPGVFDLVERERIAVYCGFDPSGDSLHVGNLIPMMALAHFQRAGHHPIFLLGGATGMIGDPSGKDEERQLLTPEALAANTAKIRSQMERFVSFEGAESAIIVNNADWLSKFSYLEFLRDVGKHFSVNAMIAKESVKRRLEEREAGISYTEFSYMLLQAYDFFHLCKEYNCLLQIGGSDQWGNITAGVDLTRRLLSKSVYGVTFGLILTHDGKKIGKSEGDLGTIWLDAARTPHYDYYQYWVRMADVDAGRLLRLYTFLPEEEIKNLEKEIQTRPEARIPQKRLAWEATAILHGKEIAEKCRKSAEFLYGSNLQEATKEDFDELFDFAPSVSLPTLRLREGISLIDLAFEAGIATSKSDARRKITHGGMYINNQRENNLKRIVQPEDLFLGPYLILRAGRNYRLVRFEE